MNKYFFCLACLIFLFYGCGNSTEEKAIEKKIEEETGAQADVDLSGKGMKVTSTADGEEYTVTTGDATEIPKGFPKDVPLYKPSKTVGAASVSSGYSVSLTTGDAIADVASSYKEQMTGLGWAEQASMDIGGQTVLVYEKNGRSANIAAMPIEGKTRITVTVSME